MPIKRVKTDKSLKSKLGQFKCEDCDYVAKSKGAITAHWNKIHRKPNARKRGTKNRRKDNQDNGRPSSLTPEVIGNLVAAFQNGLTAKQAFDYAGITKDIYYYALKTEGKFYDEFRKKMQKAQQHLNFKAREVIAKAIDEGDTGSAKWWLERKNKDEFSPRREVTGGKGGPIRTQRIGMEDIASDEEINEAIAEASK